MEEQGKRLLLAVALIMGLLFVFQTFFKSKEPDPQQQAQQQAAQVVAQQTASPSATTVGAAPAPATAPATSSIQRGPEQTIVLPFRNIVVTFSSYGGTMVSWKLPATPYEHHVTKGELPPH